VAEIVALLASGASYATGASVLVDGGLSLGAVLALQKAVE
jgi:NaMN:DMB phosphoribosyltransferase